MTQTSEPTLRIGVAGLGMGAVLMIRGIIEHPRVRINGGAARSPEVRQRFERDLEARAYANVEELCAAPDLDAIFVATPHQLHREHTICALEHGKHVIVEKPMALTLEDCDAMIAAAEKEDRKLIVGPSMSFAPAFKVMRDVISSNEIGAVRMISSWESNDFIYRARRPEELDTAKGGGVIFNQAPHQADIVRYLAGGLVRSVRASTGNWDPARPTEGSYQAFLELENGASAVMIHTGYDGFDTTELQTWLHPDRSKSPQAYGQARRTIMAMGPEADEASLKRELYSWGGKVFGTGPSGKDQQHYGVTVVNCERGDLRPWGNGVARYDVNGRTELPVPPSHGTPIRSEVVDELLTSISSGVTPPHDGRWGKATLEVSLAILESARANREILLQHQVPLEGR